MKAPGSLRWEHVFVVFAALLVLTASAQPNNAVLQHLELSAGTLAPSFTAGIFDYSASVANYVPSVNVTPTAISGIATISVKINSGGFVSVASGSPSGSLPLNVGTNAIEVRVISGNLSVTNTYAVTLTRNVPAPPEVQTLAAVVAGGTATLNGAANPGGFNSSAWFEWGFTTNYGNITSPQAIGGGTTNTNFSLNVNAPASGVVHFRAVASNYVGTAKGQDAIGATQLFTHDTDINLITGTETWPHVTQNEPAIWSHSNTIVVAYNDSRGIANNPRSFGGVSVSTNRGATFTRLNDLFTFNGLYRCDGHPTVFYSVKAGKWTIAFQDYACGNPGIGLWQSSDGVNWSLAVCAAFSVAPSPEVDGLSTWVDNNPASPFYGRQYVAFNDLTDPLPLGDMYTAYSTNNGMNWSTPSQVGYTAARSRRAGKIVGSRGTDGTVLLPILEESRGGTNLTRIHFIARSTNGGASSWSLVQVAGPVFGPGVSTNGYWAGMYDAPTAAYWREMGWGQAGVGPGGVVHYAYSACITNDPYDANIFYTRSADNGLTWSTPIQLNTDQSFQRQWNPSVSVNSKGTVFVTWYDERKSPGNLEYYGRASLDNGVSWGSDAPISDAPFIRPYQADPSVDTNYFGHHSYSAFSDDGFGDTACHAWVDGRVLLDGFRVQQDIFFDRITFGSELRITSITQAGNGDVTLLGTGRPNLGHSLQVSTNLTPGSFTNVATVTPDGFGTWNYNTGPVVPGRQFFRLALP